LLKALQAIASMSVEPVTHSASPRMESHKRAREAAPVRCRWSCRSAQPRSPPPTTATGIAGTPGPSRPAMEPGAKRKATPARPENMASIRKIGVKPGRVRVCSVMAASFGVR
jgi:hypothetical protein